MNVQDASPSQGHPTYISSELVSTRRKLNITRLRLFEADLRIDAMVVSDSWQFTAPLRWLERHWAGPLRLVVRSAKAMAWTVTGQLPRRIRAWRRSRNRAATEAVQEAMLPSSTASMPLPAQSAPGGKTILIVDESVPMADRSAGGRTSQALIAALLTEGWSAIFWPFDRQAGGNYARDLEVLGIPVLDHRFNGGIEMFLDQHGSGLDHVMLMRPHIAAALLPAVLRGTRALISYYGHDLHFARMALEARQHDDLEQAYKAERMRATERAIWRAVDVVLYPSESEAAIVRQMEPGVDARALTPYAFASFIHRATPTLGQTLLFVGGFDHRPNEDAALWLAEAILPRVLATRPTARLVIAGADPPPKVRALAGRVIEVTGRISDEELTARYDAARVAVAPLRIGAGVKGKVVEAMRAGVPVVMTTIGAQGLPNLPSSMPVHDEPDKLCDAIVTLLINDVAWMRQSAEQVHYAECHFSQAALRTSLLAALEGQAPSV